FQFRAILAFAENVEAKQRKSWSDFRHRRYQELKPFPRHKTTDADNDWSILGQAQMGSGFLRVHWRESLRINAVANYPHAVRGHAEIHNNLTQRVRNGDDARCLQQRPANHRSN